MNQRGRRQLVQKAAAEVAGCYPTQPVPDVRGFCGTSSCNASCSCPGKRQEHLKERVWLQQAACTAKLGMNGKDHHVKKGLPILEDAIAGFSVLVSADDGVSPQIRTPISWDATPLEQDPLLRTLSSSLVTNPSGWSWFLKIVDYRQITLS